MIEQIDAIDDKIIKLLQSNGRLPYTEIARSAGVSEATVRNRLQRLLDSGIIQIVAASNPFRLKYGVVGKILLDIDFDKRESIIAELKKIDKLWYIARLSGNPDLDVECFAQSAEELRGILDHIGAVEGVRKMSTSFVLEYIRNIGE